MERLEEYSVIEREAAPIIEGKRPAYAWPEHGEIVFDNLQLRYREGLDLVLRGISATIRPSEKIGVVGRTGAGKSTLMLALFRIIEVRFLFDFYFIVYNRNIDFVHSLREVRSISMD